MFEFNSTAVVLASLAGILIDIFWYSDLGLGHLWAKILKKNVTPPRRSTYLLAALNLIRHLLAAWALSILAFLYHRHHSNSWAEDVFTVGLILWVGLILFPVLYIKINDGKGIKESLVYSLQELASLAAMAAVISLVR